MAIQRRPERTSSRVARVARAAVPALALMMAMSGAVALASSPAHATPTTPTDGTADAADSSGSVGGGPAALVPANPAGNTWLDWMNWYRQSVGLAAVTEDVTRTTNARTHARYLVDFGVNGECAGYPHCESPGNAQFSAAGNDAASHSNIIQSSATLTERASVDGWMAAPFHALHMLNERLTTAGYGTYNHPDGTGSIHASGVLDVLNGVNGDLPTITDPLGFPADNTVVPLTTFGSESPDPLTPCAGFSAPAGLPIIVKFPAGVDVGTSSGSLTQGANPQQACLTEPSDYPNVGGQIMASYNAVLLIPKVPLTPGLPYTYTVTAGTGGNVRSITATFTPFGAPGAAFVTAAVAGASQATLTWTTPASTGGRPITGYLLHAFPSDGVGPPVTAQVGVVNTAPVTGLTPGRKYAFAAHALTDSQEGSGNTVARTLPSLAAAPTGVAVTTLSTGGRVAWTPPPTPSQGDAPAPVPVTSFAVTSSPGNVTLTAGSGATTLDITGLLPGVSYTFTVTATNAVGTSPASGPSNAITLPGLPDAPSNAAAVAGIRQATVSWTPPPPPSNGTWGQSAATTAFRVTASPGGVIADFPSTATSGIVTGLANATSYTFSVVALNPVGVSATSAASNQITTPSVPSAPGSVVAVPGDATANVSWTAPGAPVGGFAVTGYTVTLTPVGGGAPTVKSVGSATLSTSLTGLVNGTAYLVSVVATNAVGPSPPGNAVGPVTPRRPPDAPTGLAASPGDGQASITWAAPAFDGGSPIISYTVTLTPTAGPVKTTTVGGNVLSAQVAGMINGTAYTVTVRAANAAGPGALATAAAPVVPATRPRFHSVAPFRLLDSRPAPDGPIGLAGAWTAAQTRDLVVTGVAGSGVPGSGVTAVVLNVTGVAPTAATHLALFPAGDTPPVASNLNLFAGQVRPNLVEVKVGSGGAVSIFNNAGTINILADVVGWYDDGSIGSGGDVYRAITPFRVEDSREPGAPLPGPWTAGQERALTVVGVGGSGVPASGVSAVAVNLTGVAPSSATHVTVFPSDVAAPVASNLNLGAGEVAPNMVIVKVGADGKIKLRNNAGTVHLIVDIVGFFTNAPTGGRFTALSPFRVLDSRPGGVGLSGAWTAGQTRALTVTGVVGSGVPATGVSAVVLNLTAIFPSAFTFVTAAPTGVPIPLASNLNIGPGDVRPNLVIVKVGPDGKVNLFNNSGTVDLIADVVGWYD